ncbi:phage major capsid protein [Sinorhizobium meliloti]|uniref:phage major capsid protein n=1 Tax=Rhizobium meliloti TaxID=382 RepID=UPI0002A586D6|nr:phage major capsid protein [Sinorhizobium meliloti]AGA07740.1 phage major capsid protein, HK97 family [Sinorhizobium meliloti GR4]RVL03186.1 phage major capsid protein [Sinorhizobium meliloti]RVM94477.1 phage major capsid protein [Sinorhizobium meliloti]RVN11298.1 phage major capsid protein [Sinorhizobium meliloti]
MTIHNIPLTRSAAALLAAGQHLRRKDGGGADEVFEQLSHKFGEHAATVVKKLGEADVKMAEFAEQVAEMEQRFARGGGGFQPTRPETWGEQFTKHKGLASFREEHSRPGRFRVEMKTTLTNDPASGGSLGVPARDQVIMMPRRRMAVRDLLPVVSVSSNAVEYPAQTGRTNNAAPVAEGAVKPESALAFELRTLPTQVIAHWLPASRQVLEDVPQLRDIIDGELRYGLAFVEEGQILYGDGSGSNLDGLVPNSTAFAAPFTIASATMIDTVGLAILQNALADFPADGIVMHPSDWMRIRLLKDADGKYILGDPQAVITPALFGLPVVATQAMAVDKFLVGNFQAAATLYDRWAARVEVSTEHADFFVRNLVAILAEERIGLAVKQPLALTYGDFANVA